MRQGLSQFVKEVSKNPTNLALKSENIDFSEYEDGFKDCAQVVLSETIPSLNPYDALVFTDASYNVSTGTYTIEAHFDDKFLQRDSLYSGSTDVYDIVSLIEHGWNISDDVRVPSGMWHGHYITAARFYEPVPITKLITELFNARYAPAAIAVIK